MCFEIRDCYGVINLFFFFFVQKVYVDLIKVLFEGGNEWIGFFEQVYVYELMDCML